MTVPSWFSNIEQWFVTTEAQVLDIIVKIKADEQIVLTDIHNALLWAADQAPTIAADIQGVLKVVQVLGIVSPQLEVAIAAANAAVVALNAFAQAMKSGQGDASAVIAGYTAVKQAQVATAQAAIAAANAHTQTSAAAVQAAA